MSVSDERAQPEAETQPEGPDEGRNLEHSVSSIVAQATIEECYEVGVDLAAYPDWVENLQSAEILSTDDQGRPLTARFEAVGLGRMTSYVLAYDLSEAPHRMSWSLVSGDLTRGIEGRYVFHDMTEDPALPLTEVEYELTIDLAVPLPGFVKRRAEDKIMRAALVRFKQRVEEKSGRV